MKYTIFSVLFSLAVAHQVSSYAREVDKPVGAFTTIHEQRLLISVFVSVDFGAIYQNA